MATERPPLLDAVLDRLVARGELLPAARDHIKGLGWDRTLGREGALAKLFEFLEGPSEAERQSNPFLRAGKIPSPGERCRNPLFKPDKSKTALRRMVEVFPVKEGAAEALAAEWEFAIGRHPAPEMARAIAQRLERREYREHLEDPPPRPAAEETLLDILGDRFSDVVPHAGREALARELSGDVAFRGCYTRPRAAVVEAIARRLSNAASASHYGVEALPKDDERCNAVAAARREAMADPPPTKLHRSNPFS